MSTEERGTLQIREAVVSDLAGVLAVYADAGIETHGHLGADEARRILDCMSQYPDYKLYVAVVDGDIRGTFALLIMDNLANGGMPSGVVEDVAVPRRWQGHGIGGAMIRHAMDRCREKGCYKLSLSSNERRADAHHFYESLGFARHGWSFHVDLAGDRAGQRRG